MARILLVTSPAQEAPQPFPPMYIPKTKAITTFLIIPPDWLARLSPLIDLELQGPGNDHSLS